MFCAIEDSLLLDSFVAREFFAADTAISSSVDNLSAELPTFSAREILRISLAIFFSRKAQVLDRTGLLLDFGRREFVKHIRLLICFARAATSSNILVI